ncbi:MAG: hypothetical protein ACRCSB_00400 [Bacteroidales bacterium]
MLINEYTDERIVFEKPLGFSVAKMVKEKDAFFILHNGDKVSMTIYSEFDYVDTRESLEDVMSE